MSNPRNAKLADRIQQIMAEAFERHVKDPRLGFVTVTDVHLTGDNREATVFYTVMGDEKQQADTAAAIESAKGMLRTHMGKELGIKFTPTLQFLPDATEQSAAQMEDLLARVQASDAAAAAAAQGKHYAGEEDPYRKPRATS